ncbi:MAG TPA: DUF6569 family protein [Bryobacteraceae bacterium]|nr:DUF6569 family protein [Bryobacteraceae bacterium]
MKLITTCIAALAALAVTADAAELKLSGPYTHDNLSIYLVHGQDRFQKKYLTLGEALEQHKAVVYETSNVNVLQVQNLSAQDVYIQSGEIVKGGKQDRVLKDDIIVPSSSSKLDINVFCVEHGRWTQRGSEPAHAFAASPGMVASPAMKRAVQAEADQSRVWAQVREEQARLSSNLATSVQSPRSASSYQLTLEAPVLAARVDAFKKDLAGLADKYPDAVGYVAAVNGKVTGADVYATHDLFRKEWSKLLTASAVDAVGSARAGTPIPPPPPMADVKAAATGRGARVTEDKQINRRTNSVTADLPQGLVFETIDVEAEGGPVHRTYVTK